MSHREYVAGLSDRELEELRREVQRVQVARKRADTSPEKIEREIEQYQKSMGREDGGQWEQPASALDAYVKGAIVTHEGTRFRSLIGANVWAPPTGWRIIPETDDEGNEIPPPYVPPTSAADAYQQGERVTFDGQVWEAVRNGVAHSPSEYAADWRLIEPEPEPEPEPPEDEEPVDPEEPEPEPGDGDGDEEDEDDEPEQEPGTIDNPFAWEADVDYGADHYVTYNGALYRVVQAHTSAAHWPPDEVASLYERQE